MLSKIGPHEIDRVYRRAVVRIDDSKSGRVSKSATAATNSSNLLAMYPVFPGCIVYFGPPLAVTTAGTPDASASKTTRPKVSVSSEQTCKFCVAHFFSSQPRSAPLTQHHDPENPCGPSPGEPAREAARSSESYATHGAGAMLLVNIMRIPCFGRRMTIGRASIIWPGANWKSYLLSRSRKIMRICSIA
jgi:hypothetical protein